MEEKVKDWNINFEKNNSYFGFAKMITEASSKLPKPIYKGLLYTVFPLFQLGGNFLRRVAFNPLAKSLSPKISLKDDSSMNYENGHFISKKISIFRYFYGVLATVTTAFYINQPRTIQKLDPKRYIIDSQDFLVKNNRYTSELFFKDPIDIYVKDKVVYLNNRIFEICSQNEIENSMYQMLVMQQYVTHVGIHFISTYGNNVFRTAKLHKDKTLLSNPVLKILFVYLQEIRDVTDGHGKYDLMSLKTNNSLSFRDQELYSVSKALTTFYELLTEDLCEQSILVLENTRKVYKVYQTYIKENLDEKELQIIIDKVYESNGVHLFIDGQLVDSRSTKWTKEQTLNAICNCLFLVSYFHTKVHLNLQHLDLRSVIVYGLLNQADLAMEKQFVNQEPVLTELQNKIKEVCPGEEFFVCDVHQLL